MQNPLTPPLFPLDHGKEYLIPDDDLCRIPPIPEPSSQHSDDLLEFDNSIFKEYNDYQELKMQVQKQIDTYCAYDASILLNMQPRISHFRIEEPLMTRDVMDQQSLTSPADMCQVKKPESSCSDRQDVESSLIDEHQRVTLQGIANQVLRSLEQGMKPPSDSTTKDMASLKEVKIQVQRRDVVQDGPGEALRIQKGGWLEVAVPPWPGPRDIEMSLSWVPWTCRLRMPTIIETIDLDDAIMSKWLENPAEQDTLASSRWSWRQPGLANSEDSLDKDNGEIKPRVVNASPFQDGDIMTLVRKRKKLLRNDTDMISSILSVGDEKNAAARPLQNYIQVHAPKKLRPTRTGSLQAAEAKLNISTEPETAPASLLEEIKNPDRPPIPSPPIHVLEVPLKIIISLKVSRNMARRIEDLLPGMDLIYVDYDAFNTSIWIPGSVSRSETISSLAEEADLSVSPCTGIILTSMIEIRQKPLPGRAGDSAFNTRLEKTSLLYERLVILVSDRNRYGGGIGVVNLSTSDATAFAGFQAFAASLPTQALVYYVPGGEEVLAKWTAAMICRHTGDARIQHHISQKETSWEVFLRRAGMNIFAAKVILGMLQVSPSVISGHELYGLAAFVKMTDLERVIRFSGVLGGTRVLERVGKVIDEAWDAQ
jgi:hypothetical protein